jgi:hypothetical protein
VIASLEACGGGERIVAPEATASPESSASFEGVTQAVPSATASVEACQLLTFQASDAPSDCFNGVGEPVHCAGLDLVGEEAGLLESVADDPNLPTGFVVEFADPPQAAEEFTLYHYLDLDQDAATGLDLSSGAIALPGIDRLVGITLPSGESWTQAVGKGGYDAEIIKDEAQVSARVVGNRVVVLLARVLLTDASAAADGAPLPSGSVVAVGRALHGDAAGALPDAFTLYVGTARGIAALDYFNGDQDFQIPLAMTVAEEALYPPCPGGS